MNIEAKNVNENRIVPSIMGVCGLSIATVWTIDIIGGKKVDLSNGFFNARDPESNQLMWPHWFAEYATATGLLVGSYGLFMEKRWGKSVAVASLGALAYTSLNSLSWSLAKKERLNYAIPMFVSLTCSGISLIILF